jgi:carboxyl-terminal processing protease
MRRELIAFLLVSIFGAAPAASDCAGTVAAARIAFNLKDYAKSADLYGEAIRGGDRNPYTFYNAACSSARAGRTDEAFSRLDDAVAEGLSGVATLNGDNDLVSLRSDPRWEVLLARVRRNTDAEQALWANPAVTSPFAETLQEDLRIAGLSRMWFEVKTNFANLDLVPDVDWDALYVATLPRVRAVTSTLDYYRILAETCAKLRDGHTNVTYPKELRDRILAAPPVDLRFVEGRVFVGSIPKGVAPALSPGDEIVEIGGEPVRVYAEKHVRPWQIASTSQGLDDQTYRWALLQGEAGTTVSLSVRHEGGKTSRETLTRVPAEERRKLLPLPPDFELRFLEGGVAHVILNSFNTPKVADEFEKRLPELLGAKALILDVRDNSGGNSSVGWKILSHLLDRPTAVTRWRTRQYRPTYRAWGFPTESFGGEVSLSPTAEDTRFRGPVAVLTSVRTFSAAEDFTAAFRAMKRGLIVGETTGGSTGQPLLVRLPGGGSVRICTKRDTLADGTEWVGKGLAPDIEAHPQIEDLRSGRDRVLERALQEIGGTR